ncbi:hypothetical protein [Stenotrophomonas maltophilia]|uniref:hypothetical protein n=1 Tax=Stenotrophomonas maltophilia TaxID=40324 RepID=UPI003BF8232F
MTLEIVPGVLVNPDPLVKSYAPYAPAIGVAGYIDRWRTALDMADRSAGSQVATYGSPLEPANVLVGDSLALPIVADIDGRRLVDCATRGPTSGLEDINRKFSGVTALIVWREIAGAAAHSIATVGGLRFRRSSTTWNVSKMSGAAGTTLSIPIAASGGVAATSRMYAAIVSIPDDGAADVVLRLIGAGTAPFTARGPVSRGGTAAEQRRLRFGKDTGDADNQGPAFAEMVIWPRVVSAAELDTISEYAVGGYSL